MLKKIFDNRTPIGSWLQIGSLDFTHMMIKAGFDFLVIDMEHGSISENKLVNLLNIFDGTDCLPMVRVANNDKILIRRALDLGAKGIIVPGVQSKDDIKLASDAIFYPPKGERGIGYSKANNYGIGFDEYFKYSNDNTIFIVQIENKMAVNNIDDIFSCNDIFSYLIGPYDLSGSLGLVGDFDSKEYLNTLKIVKKSSEKYDIKSGIHIVEPNIIELESKVNEGYEFIAYSTDALLLYNRCKNDLQTIKSLKK